jgi:hypothetical protein
MLGERVIPILIKDLDSKNSDWIHALSKISGENPIKKENIGYVLKMNQDWKNWYHNKYV